ncbi:MAG: sensor histidine kinase [bacterium]|nr:MAG: sensor histidine kinase [bacterium]
MVLKHRRKRYRVRHTTERSVTTAAVLFLLVVLHACPAPADEPLRFHLKERIARITPQESRFFIADIDFDGNDDLLIDARTNLMWLRKVGHNLIPFEEGNYRMAGMTMDIHDINGDSHPEFFVSMKGEDGIYLACHDWYAGAGPSEPIYLLGPYLPDRPRTRAWPEGSIHIAGCFDADDDGQREIYFAMNPFYAKPEPRALLAHRGDTGDELWRFEMGPQIVECMQVRLTERDKRIIVSTFAPNNGSVWNGTSDSLSYIFCLKTDGSADWIKPIANLHSWNNIEIIDADHDGREDILVSRRFGPREKDTGTDGDPWSVALIDPLHGDFIRAAHLNTGVEQAMTADLDRDLIPEILVVGSDGRLFLLEDDLATSAVFDDRFHTGVVEAIDIDMNGTKEIICTGSGRLLVRDEHGVLLAEESHREQFIVATAKIGNERYIVAQSDNVIRFYTLEKGLPVPIAGAFERLRSSTGGAVVLVLIGLCAGTLIASAAFLYRRHLGRKRSSLAIADEHQANLLDAMVAFGHGGASLKVLDRLRFHLKNWERMEERQGRDTDSFGELADTFVHSVYPDLRRIVLMGRRANVSPEYWKPVLPEATRAGRMLEEYIPTAGKQSAAGGEAFPGPVLRSLDTIDECLSGIRKHLHHVFRTPVVATTCRVMAARAEDLEAIGAHPTVTIGGAYNDGVFVSATILEKVLDGLIANALRAMTDSPAPALEIAIQSEGSYCKIDVSDTGKGIPEVDRERIFDRHFTTKPEGGFGLYYAREELATFGGRIFVQDNQPGGGTTFRLVLRKT